MCGRYVLEAAPSQLVDKFDLIELEKFPPRYNIAPTQPILIIREGEVPEAGSNLPTRRPLLVKWGFMPSWVKDPRDFPLIVNARSETAINKASFKAAMRHNRVLIPATGYYEWRRPKEGDGEKSQPYYIRPKQGGVIAFAGIMETWASADGSEFDGAAILTTKANPAIRIVHERMPVVIDPSNYSRWLDCRSQEPRHIADLMVATDEDYFDIIPVSNEVNKVSNMSPNLLLPVSDAVVAKKKKEPKEPNQLSLF